MDIDESLILKLERLARLELSMDERKALRDDLVQITGMIEKLDEVDTTGIEPLMHITDVNTILAKDEVKDQLGSEEALSNAPVKQAPYFLVPKVITRS